jgi:MinD superfamily P-loop ATPase
VIASVTNADGVLVVAEPTMSGMHDMQRVIELARFLDVPAMLCINKSDLNPSIAEEMERNAGSQGIRCVGSIPYDRDMTRAMVAGKTLLEYSDGLAAQAVSAIWEKVCETVFAADEVANR